MGFIYRWYKHGDSINIRGVLATLHKVDGQFPLDLTDSVDLLLKTLVPLDSDYNETAKHL